MPTMTRPPMWRRYASLPDDPVWIRAPAGGPDRGGPSPGGSVSCGEVEYKPQNGWLILPYAAVLEIERGGYLPPTPPIEGQGTPATRVRLDGGINVPPFPSTPRGQSPWPGSGWVVGFDA